MWKGTHGPSGLLKLALESAPLEESTLPSSESVALRLPRPDPSVDRLFL